MTPDICSRARRVSAEDWNRADMLSRVDLTARSLSSKRAFVVDQNLAFARLISRWR